MNYLFHSMKYVEYEYVESEWVIFQSQAPEDLVLEYTELIRLGTLVLKQQEALQLEVDTSLVVETEESMRTYINNYNKRAKETAERNNIRMHNEPFLKRLHEINVLIQQEREKLLKEHKVYLKYPKEKVTYELMLQLEKSGYTKTKSRRGKQRFVRKDADMLMKEVIEPALASFSQQFSDERQTLQKQLKEVN